MREWPTPTATDAKASGAAGYSTASERHAGTTLTDATTRPWPTPMTINRTSDRAKYGRPTAGKSRGGPSHGLEDVIWPTATQRDWKDGACADTNVPTNGLLGRAVPRTSGSSRARLNPRWVAELMGFPHDWLAPDGATNCAPSATPSAPKWSR